MRCSINKRNLSILRTFCEKILAIPFLIFIFAFNGFTQDKDYTEWYLQRPDTDIYVREVGNGKDTVVVVHGGFGANHDYMLDAVKNLEKDFRFIFYDQRGSLMSPTAKENLTFQKNVADLYALVKELKVGKVKLFCHSMGTLVGMEFMKQHPAMVSNVVLVGAIFPKAETSKSVFSERMNTQVEQLQNRKEVQDLLQPYKNKGYENVKTLEDIDKSELTHKDLTNVWRVNFAAVNILNVNKHHLLKGGRAYYKGAASAMSDTVNWNYDYRKIMSDNEKTTIIQGDYDFLDFNAAEHLKLLKDFPSVKIEVVKNAGHNIWIDAPESFQQLLKTALLR